MSATRTARSTARREAWRQPLAFARVPARPRRTEPALRSAHSRIYILPTRRGLAMIGTLAIMLITSMNYALALGFVATFVLSGLVAAALLNTFRNLAGLTIRPASAGETFAGGPPPFTLTLSGGARTRIAISIVPRDGAPRVVDVDADTIAPVTFELETATRGRVPLGRVTHRIGLPARLVARLGVRAFPGCGHRVSGARTGGTAAADWDRPAPMHPRRDAPRTPTLPGLREYQRGDPMQRVAWKAVARGAGWYTKAFDGAGGGGPGGSRFRCAAGVAFDRAEAFAARRRGCSPASTRRVRIRSCCHRRASSRRRDAIIDAPCSPRLRCTICHERRMSAVAQALRLDRTCAHAAFRIDADAAADQMAGCAAVRRAGSAAHERSDLGRRVRPRAHRRAPVAADTRPLEARRVRRRASPRGRCVLFAIVAALMIRASYGTLLGRDPSVAFMVVLASIKFLEARSARDGTLLVCLGAFLSITPFLFGQSPLSALAMLPALLAVGGALAALGARTPQSTSAAVAARGDRDDSAAAGAGPSACRDAVRPVPAPRRAAVGPAANRPRDDRPVRHDVAGPHRRVDAGRFRRAARGFRRTAAALRASLLARAGAVALRRRHLDVELPAGRRTRSSPPPAAPISYTVTLEPSERPWLFALELPAALPRFADDTLAGDIAVTRDQQLLSRRPIGQVLRYTQLSLLSDRYPAHADDVAEHLRLPPQANPRTREFAQALRDAPRRRPRVHRCDPRAFPRGKVRLHARAGRACGCATRSTTSCSTRGAASASTTQARLPFCCAPPASRRGSSPAIRAASSTRAATI